MTDNNITFSRPFETGYLKAEQKFCRTQEDELYDCKLEHPHAELSMLRQNVLRKREEFQKLWLKGKIKI